MGCDSIIVFKVEVYVLDISLIDIFFCSSSDGLFWGDSFLLQLGVYIFIYFNVQGCDSIVQVLLVFVNSSFSVIDIFYCEGEFFWWGDILLFWLGLYIFVYCFVEGCDSIL